MHRLITAPFLPDNLTADEVVPMLNETAIQLMDTEASIDQVHQMIDDLSYVSMGLLNVSAWDFLSIMELEGTKGMSSSVSLLEGGKRDGLICSSVSLLEGGKRNGLICSSDSLLEGGQKEWPHLFICFSVYHTFVDVLWSPHISIWTIHRIVIVITYPCQNYKWDMLVKDLSEIIISGNSKISTVHMWSQNG